MGQTTAGSREADRTVKWAHSETGTWSNDEAAAYLGCTPDTLRIWTSKRRVPFVKIGRLTRFRKRDLDEYIQANVVPAQAR